MSIIIIITIIITIIIASLARRLANSIVDWDELSSLVSCRLIALDKSPGVRPIGVGETLRRILGKTICLITRSDIEEICGIKQLCAGLQAGIEGAVHVISDLFDNHSDEGWGVLMMDASNAFNSINRFALLWNSRVLWPRCSRFLFNTYQGWAPLILKDTAEVLYSKEGIVQGDPLSMFIYAMATLPLVNQLDHPQHGVQVWFADDASACDRLDSLRIWMKKLISLGPAFGYHPEPKKSFLVVDNLFEEDAIKIFEDTGVNIVMSHRFLGSVIGDQEGKDNFVRRSVSDWISQLVRLVKIAQSQPQAAYAAFTKSLQNKWLYLQRLVPSCSHLFKDIENIIASNLLPTIFGCEISSNERSIFTLPTRMGGLNIQDPTEQGDLLYSTSRHITEIISQAIRSEERLFLITVNMLSIFC